MEEKDTIHQAYAILSRKHDGVDEIMLVTESDGEVSFPGGAMAPGDADMVTALRRHLQAELQVWPEQYEAVETGITYSFEYERPESPHFGKTGVVELFDVTLRPGIEARPTDGVKAARWYAFDEAGRAVAHEGHRRLLLMAQEYLSAKSDGTAMML